MSAPSRLSRFMDLPEGIDASQALTAAGENLNAHRDDALGLIDKALADLAQSDSAEASSEAVARLADSVASLAGMFELVALSRAAKRLGDTVRVMMDRQIWDSETVSVHVAALRVLRTQTDPAGAAMILQGLDQLVARLMRQPGA